MDANFDKNMDTKYVKEKGSAIAQETNNLKPDIYPIKTSDHHVKLATS